MIYDNKLCKALSLIFVQFSSYKGNILQSYCTISLQLHIQSAGTFFDREVRVVLLPVGSVLGEEQGLDESLGIFGFMEGTKISLVNVGEPFVDSHHDVLDHGYLVQ